MASSEHVLVRMGAAGRGLFVGLALALLSFAFFCLTFTVDLRCESVAEHDLFCSMHGHSLFHDGDESIEARDVREVKTVMRVHASSRRRPMSMLAVYAIGESEVLIPIANSFLVFPETRRRIAAELDAFVQRESDVPYSRHIAGEPLLRALIASLMLVLLLAVWGATRSTRVAVDRGAGTVTISRRLLGFPTSRKVVSLARTVSVIGKPRKKGQDLFLELTQGEPVHIQWVPHHRAVADFAALKRLFPLDLGAGGISR